MRRDRRRGAVVGHPSQPAGGPGGRGRVGRLGEEGAGERCARRRVGRHASVQKRQQVGDESGRLRVGAQAGKIGESQVAGRAQVAADVGEGVRRHVRDQRRGPGRGMAGRAGGVQGEPEAMGVGAQRPGERPRLAEGLGHLRQRGRVGAASSAAHRGQGEQAGHLVKIGVDLDQASRGKRGHALLEDRVIGQRAGAAGQKRDLAVQRRPVVGCEQCAVPDGGERLAVADPVEREVTVAARLADVLPGERRLQGALVANAHVTGDVDRHARVADVDAGHRECRLRPDPRLDIGREAAGARLHLVLQPGHRSSPAGKPGDDRLGGLPGA